MQKYSIKAKTAPNHSIVRYHFVVIKRRVSAFNKIGVYLSIGFAKIIS